MAPQHAAPRVDDHERLVGVADEDPVAVRPDRIDGVGTPGDDAAGHQVKALGVDVSTLRRARACVVAAGAVALFPGRVGQQAPVPDERAGPVAGRVAGRPAAVLDVGDLLLLRARQRRLADAQLEVVAAVRLLPEHGLAAERELGDRVEPDAVVVALDDRPDRLRRLTDPPEHDLRTAPAAVARDDRGDDVPVGADDRGSGRQRKRNGAVAGTRTRGAEREQSQDSASPRRPGGRHAAP